MIDFTHYCLESVGFLFTAIAFSYVGGQCVGYALLGFKHVVKAWNILDIFNTKR